MGACLSRNTVALRPLSTAVYPRRSTVACRRLSTEDYPHHNTAGSPLRSMEACQHLSTEDCQLPNMAGSQHLKVAVCAPRPGTTTRATSHHGRILFKSLRLAGISSKQISFANIYLHFCGLRITSSHADVLASVLVLGRALRPWGSCRRRNKTKKSLRVRSYPLPRFLKDRFARCFYGLFLLFSL